MRDLTQPWTRSVAVATLIACAQGLCACGQGDKPSQPEVSAPALTDRLSRDRGPARPNIVLVSLDTLRADRLHCYGNPRNTSPRIDELARDGVLFSQAFATSPWTLPSHLSLFTSQYPGRFFHGISGLEGEPGIDHPIAFQLGAEDPSLAVFLEDAGYDTVGLHGGAFVARDFGFHHGFRRYEPAGIKHVFRRAAQYLRSETHDNKPFFLFVHTYITHQPYRFEEVYGDPEHRPPGLERFEPAENMIDGAYLTPLEPDEPLYGWTPNPEQRDYFLAVYDGGVREADKLVGGLLDTLKELENTQIIITFCECMGDKHPNWIVLGHHQLPVSR